MSSSSSSSLVSNFIVFHLAAAIFPSFRLIRVRIMWRRLLLLVLLLLLARWSYRFHIVKLQIPLSLRLQKQCQTRVFRCQYEKKRSKRKKEMLMMY